MDRQCVEAAKNRGSRGKPINARWHVFNADVLLERDHVQGAARLSGQASRIGI